MRTDKRSIALLERNGRKQGRDLACIVKNHNLLLPQEVINKLWERLCFSQREKWDSDGDRRLWMGRIAFHLSWWAGDQHSELSRRGRRSWLIQQLRSFGEDSNMGDSWNKRVAKEDIFPTFLKSVWQISNHPDYFSSAALLVPSRCNRSWRLDWRWWNISLLSVMQDGLQD